MGENLIGHSTEALGTRKTPKLTDTAASKSFNGEGLEGW